MQTPRKSHLAVFIICVSLISFTGGYSMAYTNIATDLFHALYHLTSQRQKTLYDSLISASYIAGTAIGSILGGKLVQRGRRRLLILGCILFIIGTGLNLIVNIYVFLFARIFMGIAYGLIVIGTPRLMEEYVPPHLWGLFSPIFVFSVAIGAVISCTFGLLLPPDKSPPEVLRECTVWYYIFGFPIIPMVIGLVFLCTCIDHESPKYLLMQEQTDRNIQLKNEVIRKIYPTNCQEDVEIISDYINSTIQQETSSITLKEAFCSDDKYKRANWTNLMHIFFHEMCGVNVVGMQSNIILAKMGQNSVITPRLGTIIIGIVGLTGHFLAFAVIPRFGRCAILKVGYFCIALCHFAVAVLTIYGKDVWVIIFLGLFEIAYNCSSGQLAWIYATETCSDIAFGVIILTLWSIVII